jgi:hypothetical protein
MDQASVAAFVKNNSTAVWGATAGYFAYVVLGGIDHDVHHHVYTGDENDPVLTRLRKGCPVTFREDVYDEFFSFKHYFTTYRIHVLTAGAWLLSGVYNLRNVPEYAGKSPDGSGRALYEGWTHRRLSGYTYVLTSAMKGATASALSVRSHSLGFARWPMAACGMYDVVSLLLAVKYVLQGNVPEHKRWMIRNFGVGAGSIWVRVFAAVWAAFDLNFMKDANMYRKMNNVVLCTGFAQGIIFSEWWLARDDARRKLWAFIMAANVALTLLGARDVYAQLRREKEQEAQR